MSVTIKDVAARAQVSVATASRALNDSAPVSPQTRARVRQAVQDLSYRPNNLARGLKQSRSNIIGLVVSDIRNPFFAQLAHAVQTELLHYGYVTLLGNATEEGNAHAVLLDKLSDQQVDGVIAVPRSDTSGKLKAMVENGMPMVFVDRIIPDIEVPSILTDPEPGINQTLDHLRNNGHQRIAFLAGPQQTSTGRERLESFTSRVNDPKYSCVGSYESKSTRQAIEILLQVNPSAIILGYSPHLFDLFSICAKQGISIPQDLAVVTFDNLAIFGYLTPTISVIDQDIELMAHLAVVELLNMITGKKPQSHRIPTRLIPRQSSQGTKIAGNKGGVVCKA